MRYILHKISHDIQKMMYGCHTKLRDQHRLGQSTESLCGKNMENDEQNLQFDDPNCCPTNRLTATKT